MIFGAHVIVSSNDATADRAFFRDVLGFSSVDAGHDWLIFALPPAEMAVHPAEGTSGHELYLMSDDLNADMAALSQGCPVFGDRGSKVGFANQNPASRRRRTKALPGEASIPPGTHFTITTDAATARATC